MYTEIAQPYISLRHIAASHWILHINYASTASMNFYQVFSNIFLKFYPCEYSDQLVVHLNLARIGASSFATLIFTEIQVTS